MSAHSTNRTATWKTRLEIETLEERALMSASPLNWTAPGGSPNNIYLGVIGTKIEIFDNGRLVAHRDASATTSITITTSARVKNTIDIASTPTGVPTTINLKGAGDSVFIGDTGTTAGKSPLSKLSILPIRLVSNTTIPISKITLGGVTTPTIAAATMANILGAVTINGNLARGDSVTLGDSADTGSHHVILNATSVTGLAPAAINFSGISALAVDGSSGQSAYAVTAAAGHTYLTLEGGGDRVSVTSTSGTVTVYGKFFDSAFLAGPTSGVNSLTAGPGGATLSGTGYSDQVAGFTHITVDSQSASDGATLHGGAGGGNTFTASPTDAVLSYGIDTVEAVNFPAVTAFGADSSTDVATLTGAATGTNSIVAVPDDVSIVGTGYYIGASGFGVTSEYSESASDTASLYGSSFGTNTLVATPTQATLSGTGFRNTVYGCPSVTAHGGYAGDTAYLFGATSGANNLVATPSSTSMTGPGYSNTANNFAYVYVYSASTSDVANLSGAGSFLYATPTVTQLSGAGYFVQTSSFPTTYETMTSNTFELTSTGSLLERVPLAILTTNTMAADMVGAAPGAFAISGIHNIVATYWTTVDSAFDTVAIGKLIDANDVWDCNSTGIHIFGPAPTGAAVGIALTLNDLTNPGIQSVLFRDMVRDGALTYNGMLDTFNVVEEGTTVDAGTLQDLQLIVRCASTLLMPADVADLANSVINGEAGNGTFRCLNSAGNVVTTAMGNLSAGSSTYQLTMLVDTWFLGIDEPDAARPYSAVQGSLFSSGGPVYTDVRQGTVGDCWLLASVAEVAARDPGYLTSMFTDEGTNTINGATVEVYSVRFYSHEGYGVPHYVTVDTELPAGGGMYDHPGTGGPLWVALLEKAYAEAAGAGWVTTSHGNTNSYGALDGGWPSYALPALTNLSTYEHDINAGAAATAFQAGDLVCLCTGDSPNSNTIVPDHCYALVSYDPTSTSPFQIYNPWGTDANGNAGQYNGHTVLGLFNATAAFANSNFNKDSFASAAPDSHDDDLAGLLAEVRARTTAQAELNALLVALAESRTSGHSQDCILAA
jgi:hypothetical protein